MKSPLIFTDLDDTLFQTERKCPVEMGDSMVMSILEDGRVSGFASERQRRFTDWLRAGRLVPVTARSREVLKRVTIEQEPAICANGGCIVTAEGSVDREWHSKLENRSREAVSVRELYIRSTESLDVGTFRHWVVPEGGLDLYFVIKANGGEERRLDGLEEELRDRTGDGWRVHRNGNNLALLPPWLNKRNAVIHLLAKARETDAGIPAIGIGDSRSDVGFMDLCDFAVTPTNSQIWDHVAAENDWCE